MSKFTWEQIEAMQRRVHEKRGAPPPQSIDNIVLAVPMLAPGLNGSNGLIRMHFTTYKKVKDKWTRAIRERCNARASTPCSILVERYYATHAMDLDNLYSTVKIPLDALRSSGVIPEDDPSCVEALKVVQIKVAKKVDQHTRITITSIPKE